MNYLDIIKEFEGFESRAYLCPAGVWTIGYGTTKINNKPVKQGQVITQAEAEQELVKHCEQVERDILQLVKAPLNDNQKGALISFVYNIGIGAFKNSTLLRLLNAGDFTGAAEQFARWNKAAGKVLPGLTRRRAAEKELFVKED
ncbi:lysozyme [Novispirillum itersonii]|uniref:lysozyme n=1 Tax=Novispirillum itersonii TaxID=189 RepID=UPI00037F008D|nr:lysozyme [Novispirillum itersonii]